MFEPWPHQREAIARTVAALRHGGRVSIVAACGTGKTDIGLGAAEALNAGRVLVVVPTLGLLEQTMAVYAARPSTRRLGRIVAVCSGASSHVRRLPGHDGDLLVTTSATEVVREIGGTSCCTVFSTNVSVAAVLEKAHREGLAPWDLIVVDEAHRTAGASGRPWSAVHDDRRLPARRRLYLTATPRLIAGAGLSGPDSVASMDDPQVFGHTGYELRFAEAIELGLLADYRVVVAVVDEQRARNLLDGGPDRPATITQEDLNAAVAQVALFRTARQYRLQRVISFHNRVARAEHFASTFSRTAELLGEQAAGICALHVSGRHSSAYRAEVLQRLRADDGGLVVVANARVLAEGVDVPAVDAVLFADPRGSTVDAIQAVGRALRRGDRPDKTATIIVPVLVGPGQDADLTASGSPFSGVWEILRALRAHDQRAAVDLDLLHDRSLHPIQDRRPLAPPPWLMIDGGGWPDGFVEALTIAAVDLDGPVLEAQWYRYLAAARRYRQVHGHLRIPRRWISPDGLAVGAWIRTQRHNRRRLAPRRLSALDALGMVWDVRADRWEAGLHAAARYAAAHGHLHPAHNYQDADGFRLGAWLNNLRARASTLRGR